MGGCSDEFHPPVVCLPVGIGPFEARKEGVVDVDDAPGKVITQLSTEDLHVAGQNHQVHVFLLDHAAKLVLEIGFRLGNNHPVRERHSVEISQRPQDVMIGHDTDDIDGKSSRAPLEQELINAMPGLGREQQHTCGALLLVDVELRIESFSHGVQNVHQIVTRGSGQGDTCEETPCVGGSELLTFGDVASQGDDGSGEGMYDARTIRASQRHDEVLHEPQRRPCTPSVSLPYRWESLTQLQER